MSADFDAFLRNILSDLRVELSEEFDRNFERKSFFGVPWAPTKRSITRGSLMLRTGALRQSIAGRVSSTGIVFTSSLPYAAIHNEGGTLTVTPAMKRFFWAMYYKASGAVPKKKDGTSSKGKKAEALNTEAAYYKNMALMKVGSKITIPQRQFLGHHPQIDSIIEKIVDENVRELETEITAQLRSLPAAGRR